jgi:hypothetical protein
MRNKHHIDGTISKSHQVKKMQVKIDDSVGVDGALGAQGPRGAPPAEKK